MKETNFDNELYDDDETLINLLRTSIKLKPSDKFVDNTLKKYLTLRATNQKAHRPLKSPLFMMVAIGSILVAPIFLTHTSQAQINDSGSAIVDILETMTMQFDSWYVYSPLLLLLASVSIIWIQLSLRKFQNISV